MAKKTDDNDMLKSGELPKDPATGTEKAKLRVVKSEEVDNSPYVSTIATEHALLGALLWAGANSPGVLKVTAVIDILPNSEAFLEQKSGIVYDAILACANAGCDHDPVAVYAQIQKSEHGRIQGGMNALMELKSEASTVNESQSRHFATQIKANYARRQAIQQARELLEAATDPKVTASSLSEKALATANSISSNASSTAASLSAKDSAKVFFQKLSDGGRRAFSTGLTDLDIALNGGLRASEVTIIAARVSLGKSACSCQISKHIVTKYPDVGVLYVSLEMDHDSFTARMVSAEAGVPLSSLRRAQLTQDQWSAVTSAVASLAEKGLYFVDSPVQTMSSIYSAALERSRILAREGKQLGMIVIDHIGLVKPSSEATKKMSREGQVAETSRALRFLASKLNCHVLGIAQINRAAEAKGAEGMPRLHHLRESGSIEADADTVLILHRERDPKTGLFNNSKPAALAVAKARLDETSIMLLQFDKISAKFSDWTDPTTYGDHYGF